MQFILRQSFPLGRFHATPWRVNPFDDAYGEWPPSPWRLARAIAARWYQWRREAHGTFDEAEFDALIAALCCSSYRFHLPPQALRGEPVRQYHPVEFGWNPKAKKASGMRSYSTSLVQDSYWCVPDGDAGAVFWFIDGDRWTEELVHVLDRCLERIIYFGRAESLTRFDRPDPPPQTQVNCMLREGRATADAVHLLVPSPEATRRDIERVTADAAMTASVPPGARLMYASRPARPVLRPRIRPVKPPASNLIQLAIGWHVAPGPRATVRMTQRFRSAVLHELIRIETNQRTGRWSEADRDTRSRIELMTGKDASGQPLSGDHRHSEFFIWWQDGKPTRLIIWRAAVPFNDNERAAIWAAAERDLSWQVISSQRDDPWRLRLVPLDDSVDRPREFNGTASQEWCSMTPYVPPRHHLRGGKLREAEAIDAQVRRELVLRQVCPGDNVDIEVHEAHWVAVHVPRRHADVRPFLGDRRGYEVSLRFQVPVAGPLRLGHSASFGLGLFTPCC